MKFILVQLYLYLLICTNYSCYGQKLIQKPSDAPKLEKNKSLFVNKPFSTLLKQIGPAIKSVYAETNRSEGAPGFFIIKFIDNKEQKKFTKSKKTPIRITVFIKEKFIWDKTNKPVDQRETWTNEDIEKYKDLTVIDIRVYGEAAP
jgi:hypothetical protein